MCDVPGLDSYRVALIVRVNEEVTPFGRLSRDERASYFASSDPAKAFRASMKDSIF